MHPYCVEHCQDSMRCGLQLEGHATIHHERQRGLEDITHKVCYGRLSSSSRHKPISSSVTFIDNQLKRNSKSTCKVEILDEAKGRSQCSQAQNTNSKLFGAIRSGKIRCLPADCRQHAGKIEEIFMEE
eukprot:Gb_19439 [translate_table: standard]